MPTSYVQLNQRDGALFKCESQSQFTSNILVLSSSIIRSIIRSSIIRYLFSSDLWKINIQKENSPSIHHSESIPLSRQSSLLLFPRAGALSLSLSPLTRSTCFVSIRDWCHSHSFSPFIFISFARYGISTSTFAFIYYSPARSETRVRVCARLWRLFVFYSEGRNINI